MGAKRIATDALLSGIALSVFIIELQIPAPVPIPGVKLGLANIVTLFALSWFSPWDAAMILFVRIFLGCLFTGRMISFWYSLAGGVLCLCVMIPLVKRLPAGKIWICSIAGAIAHNVGQIFVAVIVTRTPAVFAYLPVLVLTGAVTGLFTGMCAYFLIRRLKTRFFDS